MGRYGMRHLTAALAALLAVVTVCLGRPTAAVADDITDATYGSITRLVVPDEVTQGEASSLTFDFEIASYGTPFALGDTYEFPTNLGELFEITGESTLEVRNAAGELVAVVDGAPDHVTVTMREGAAGETIVAGGVTTPALTANDVGAEPGSPVTKTLTLGNQTADIVFTEKDPGEEPPASLGEPDWNQLWKLGWTNDSHTRATTAIEVNPFGNIDLYQTRNAHNPRTVTTWRNFYVEDVIPEHGQIDLSSMKIYAVVNTVAVAGPDSGYAEGSLYAQRSGTSRLLIDRVSADSDRVRIFMLTQEPGETKEQFKARILSEDLQWGVYTETDADGLPTQTLMMNFGDLGDPQDNNGIMFNDFLGTQADDKIRAHQELFGPGGATGGNVVSYYTEFDSTYPYVEGEKTFRNYASWEADCITKGSSYYVSKGGNESGDLTIVNGAGEALASSGSVVLTLVDEESRAPIPGAAFKLQADPEGDGWYADTALTARTDEQGQLRFSSLAQGHYRLVQLDTAPGYSYDNKTYAADPSAAADPGAISGDGEFEIWANSTFTVFARATNAPKGYHVSYRFTSSEGDDALPEAVTALLPTDDQTYRYGDEVTPQDPARTSVAAGTDESWEFQGYRAEGGYDAERGAITGDVTFVGLWQRVSTVGDDAPYTVEYYYMEDGRYPEQATSSVKRVGETGATVSVADWDKLPANPAEHVFDDSAANVLEGVVAGDGSLVLRVYFKQQLTVTYEPGEHGAFEPQVTSGLDYGAETPAFAGEPAGEDGYRFTGWAPAVAETVTADATYVAQWEAEADDDTDTDTEAAYTVEYYFQDPADGEFEVDASLTSRRTGTAGVPVAVTDGDKAVERDGYVFDEGNASNVLEVASLSDDGSTTLRVYYKLSLDVTYDLNGGTSDETLSYPGNDWGVATPTISDPTRDGYRFTGWAPAVAETVTADATYVAQWEAETNDDADPGTPTEKPDPDEPGGDSQDGSGDGAHTEALAKTGDVLPGAAPIVAVAVLGVAVVTVALRHRSSRRKG